jgi:hypothetical protein
MEAVVKWLISISSAYLLESTEIAFPFDKEKGGDYN